MREELESLKNNVLEDGVVDEEEVVTLRSAVFDDDVSPGAIDKDEMQMLVDIADGAADQDNHSSFETLYLDAVRNRYLEDDESPGAIDESEANEIVEMFWGDGNLNRYERSALNMLRTEATEIHQVLAEKMEFLGI